MKSQNNLFDESTAWKGLIQGNRDSFDLIYQMYFKSLYHYGRKLCHDPIAVEDAIHDLFLDLWRYRENLSFTTSIRFYLFRALRRRIVKNNAKDIEATIFSGEAGLFHFLSLGSCEDSIVQTEQQDEQLLKLKRSLNNLSQRQYEALMLRFYGDFSYDEIASMMEVNEQSARNLVQRALEQLRNFTKILSSFILFALGF